MNLEIVVDSWEALKQYVHTTEIKEAAESLVTVLIDGHGLGPQEVYDAFKGDRLVRRVMQQYLTHDTADADDEIDELDFEDD